MAANGPIDSNEDELPGQSMAATDRRTSDHDVDGIARSQRRRVRLLPRCPKARGAVRAAGLVEAWSAESESTAEIVDRLLSEGVRGRCIAFRLRGVADDDRVEPALGRRPRTRGARLSVRTGASPAPMAVLRALVRAGGSVVDRQSLLAELPSAVDEHAVEVAVARLRSTLGMPGLVETAVKRGYRVPVADG